MATNPKYDVNGMQLTDPEEGYGVDRSNPSRGRPAPAAVAPDPAPAGNHDPIPETPTEENNNYQSQHDRYVSGEMTPAEQQQYLADMQEWRDNSGGSGGSGGGGGGAKVTSINMPTPVDYSSMPLPVKLDGIEPGELNRTAYYDKEGAIANMEREMDAARAQYTGRIDNATDTEAAGLQRALADAQGQYRAQQEQITAEELRAMDNAALYAEARGDKGGIGQAQYNSVQNTAARNRATVSQAQTKFATDTARQISDLRAKGEFQKADALLSIAQTQLSQLRQIEDHAASFDMSADQMNNAVTQWEYDTQVATQQYANSLEMSLAEMTGAFSNGVPTWQARQQTEGQLANIALTLIEAGTDPNKLSEAQLSALMTQYGFDEQSLLQYYKKFKKK